MTDSSTSIKSLRNTASEETATVLAHKKKLAPISLNSEAKAKGQKFTTSGSLIEDGIVIGKDGIKDPRTYSDVNDANLANHMNKLSLQTSQSAGQDDGEDQLNMKMADLEKIKALGQGSQGSVDLMRHGPTNSLVALKSLTLNTDEKLYNQMKIELSTLRKCNCEHIIKCYGVFYQQGIINFALEYMDVGTLDDVLKRIGKIPEVILGTIAYQVLKGLEYLHRTLKVIHRDIKPSNLLINSQGEVKISDFGVSGEVNYTLDYKDSWVGTAVYMSPERFGGEKYMNDTDIWSLGLTIVECALGRFPYPQPGSAVKQLSIFDLMQCISGEPAPTLPDDFSAEIKDFVAVCLRKEGGTRSSATELLKHPFIVKYSKLDITKFQNWLKNLPAAKK